MRSPYRVVSSAYDIWRQQSARALTSSARNYLARNTMTRWKASRKDTLTVSCDDITVTFDTRSDVAKEWFYPRYLDGSLHEPAMTQELLDALNTDTTFYDIGALMGYYTVFASVVCTEGEIHSFEMDPRFVQAIERSLARNNNEATVVRRAISNSSGQTVSYAGDVGLTAIASDESQTNGDAKTLALDDYVDGNTPPDVMKMDIEGFEYQALRGAEGMLERGYPETMFLEVHPPMIRNYGNSVADILDLLNKYDYSYAAMNHREKTTTREQVNVTEIEQQNNIVLVCHHER